MSSTKQAHSTFERPQRQADAGYNGVPGALFLLRIFKVKAMNRTTRAAGKVAPTVKDHSVTLRRDGEE